MEQEITKEQVEEMRKAEAELTAKAQEYVFNILDLGTTYNEKEYLEKLESQKSPENYTNFTEADHNINMVMLTHGYGNFGRKFIDAVAEKDKDSLVNMFEIVTQEYLDLQAYVSQFVQMMEQSAQAKETVKDALADE